MLIILSFCLKKCFLHFQNIIIWISNAEILKKAVWRPKAKLLQLKLIHIFARAILSMKKLESEKTKPTFIISVLKVDY